MILQNGLFLGKLGIAGGGGGPGSGTADAVSTATPYACLASVAVRNVVYLSAADTVALGDADDPGKQPVIGFVTSKPTTTTCVVQYSGELTGFSGLVAGSTYYLSETPGDITSTPPSAMGSTIQRVGVARSTTILNIEVDRDYVVL